MSTPQDGTFPIFYNDAVPDPVETRNKGRACFKNEERVRIMIPGDRNNIGVFPVEEKHRSRWPDAYARFKETNENVIEGTPLETWAYMDRLRVLELKAMNIHTIEQLANTPDDFVRTFGPGGADLVAHAKSTIAADPLGVGGIQAMKERDEYKVIVENQRTEVEELRAQIAAMQKELALAEPVVPPVMPDMFAEPVAQPVTPPAPPVMAEMPVMAEPVAPPVMAEMPGMPVISDDEV